MRILFVDDDPRILEAYIWVVQKKLGLDADIASTVDTALLKLSNNQYDLIVSDLVMPGGSGLDLYREVRKNYGDSIPFALVTALTERVSGTFDDRTYMLEKPMTTPALVDFIERILKDVKPSTQK